MGKKVNVARLGLDVGSLKSQVALAVKTMQQINVATRQNTSAIAKLNKQTVEGTKAVRGYVLSWRSLARIFATGSMIRAFTQFQVAMEQSIRNAAEFEVRVAEIQTISQRNQQTFEDWTQQVRALSDEFGSPLLQTAEGLYEAISNQIAEGAEATQFMAEAQKLAITTVSSTADAVNALSSVINSYNLGVSDAAEISGTFFKLVDVGRVRLGEMSNTIGTVTAVASQLGINFKEVSAFIGQATIQGVKFNNAATFLRNLIIKLLKPTVEMKKLFREWGVESGEAAIRTFGFQGVLQRLNDEVAKGGVPRLAELINRIRGLQGALLTIGNNMDKTNEAFMEFNNTAKDVDKEFRLIEQTAGRAFKKELNRISNFFTVDLGQKAVQAIVSVGETFGGFSKIIINGVKSLAVAITTAATAFAGYKLAALGAAAASAAAAAKMGVLQLSLVRLQSVIIAHPLLLFVSAIAAGTAALVLFSKTMDERVSKAFETMSQSITDFRDNLTEKLTKAIGRINSFIDPVEKKVLNVFANLRSKSFKTFETMAETIKNSDTKLKDLSKTFIDNFSTAIRKAENNIQNLNQIIKSSVSNINKLKFDREQLGFERGLEDVDSFERGLRSIARADTLKLRAEGKAIAALRELTKGNIELGDTQLKEALRLGEMALKLSDEAVDRFRTSKQEVLDEIKKNQIRDIDDVIERQKRLTVKLSIGQKRRIQRLESQKKNIQEIESLEDLGGNSAIEERLDIIQSTNKAFSQQKDIVAAIIKIQEQAAQVAKQRRAEEEQRILKLKAQRDQFENAFRDILGFKVDIDETGRIDQVARELQNTFGRFQQLVSNLRKLEAFEGLDISTKLNLANIIEDRLQRLRVQGEEKLFLMRQKEQEAEFKKRLDNTRKAVDIQKKGLEDSNEKLVDSLKQITGGIVGLSETSGFNTGFGGSFIAGDEFAKTLGDLSTRIQALDFKKLGNAELKDITSRIVALVPDLQKGRQEIVDFLKDDFTGTLRSFVIRDLPGAEGTIQRLVEQISDLRKISEQRNENERQVTELEKRIAISLGQFRGSVENQLVPSTIGAADALRQFALKILSQRQVIGVAPSAQLPRLDTPPPQNRVEGARININVAPGSTGEATARTIGKELRRMVARGEIPAI